MKRKIFKIKTLYWSIGFLSGLVLILKAKEECVKRMKLFQSSLFYDNQELFSNEAEVENNRVSREFHDENIQQSWPDELNCAKIEKLFKEAMGNSININNKEASEKGVYYATIENDIGFKDDVLVKHVRVFNTSLETDMYRYHKALLEIENLRKLQIKRWEGIPKLHGACVHPQEITYVTSQFSAVPLCSGDGLSFDCSLSKEMKRYISQQPNAGYSTLLWMSKVTCFFKQFEKDQVFMEDISGINFNFFPETLDIFLVNVDSLIFLNNVKMISRASCRHDHDCNTLAGNLWKRKALNHKIYRVCKDGRGNCINNICRGFDTSLHICGIAQWLLYPLSVLVPPKFREGYNQIVNCMLEKNLEERCSFAQSCKRAENLLEFYNH